MSVTATIVVGADGSSSINGSSTQVTSAADRENFLKRRRLVDCIVIGGNTARNEPYVKTPVPLVVISRHSHPKLPAAHVWNIDPCDGVIRAAKEFGENSVTPVTGGTDTFDFSRYLERADSLEKQTIDGTIFYIAQFKRQK
ncbi:MAG: hypothetical protein NTZ66_00360 [Actinobacteria bacterium]|nr:hypothetical protein [Actinomycetota bacterium]